MVSELVVRRRETSDDAWIIAMLTETWGSTRVVSRGRMHDAMTLPGFVAVLDGQSAGLATHDAEGDSCELVTLNSLIEKRGVGMALIEAVKTEAGRLGCRRLWLITTNDNTHALRFYQRRGFFFVALHKGAIADSRRLKPEIPAVGNDGIPIRDEIELAIELS